MQVFFVPRIEKKPYRPKVPLVASNSRPTTRLFDYFLTILTNVMSQFITVSRRTYILCQERLHLPTTRDSKS